MLMIIINIMKLFNIQAGHKYISGPATPVLDCYKVFAE